LLQCQALWLGFAFGIRGGEGGAYPQRGGRCARELRE